MTILRANNHRIELSHEHKVYFPEDGITKGDLVAYYAYIAPMLLRYVKNRLLTLQRFPGGISGEAFYQKNAPDYFPEWIVTKQVKKKTSGTDNYIICNNKATLLYLINQACITPHVWLSTADQLNYPDCIIWDLDPPHGVPVDFSHIAQVAYRVRDMVEALGMSAWVMTTGSRGVHVRVPIRQEYPFDKVRAFARAIAQRLVAEDPERITIESRIKKRGKRLLIDVMRNGFGATAVPPYAVRALPGAPIATPITWEELGAKHMHARRYTITNIDERLAQHGDLWRNMKRSQRSLRSALLYLKN